MSKTRAAFLHSVKEGVSKELFSVVGLIVYLPELCESELSSPHFSLATKTVGTDQLEPAQRNDKS